MTHSDTPAKLLQSVVDAAIVDQGAKWNADSLLWQDMYGDICDSPIEALFLRAYTLRNHVRADLWGTRRLAVSTDSLVWHKNKNKSNIATATVEELAEAGNDLLYKSGSDNAIDVIACQHRILSYRADFVIVRCYNEGISVHSAVVVECDGHDYHERTKEQAASDRSRDRAMLSAGFRVMRFTGSELWRDCNACCEEVDVYLDTDLDRQLT